jgi:hypothetical protein
VFRFSFEFDLVCTLILVGCCGGGVEIGFWIIDTDMEMEMEWSTVDNSVRDCIFELESESFIRISSHSIMM